MADNSYNIMVSNPVTPFTMSRSFKACSNGKIFIGLPDTDPTFPQNQIPVYVESECGNTVQVPQPIVINTAGYPVYHGQVAKFVTTQNYSMAVYDSYMVQQFYWPDISKINPDAISSQDGFSVIGQVDGSKKLRLIEPWFKNQRILLSGINEGELRGGGEFYFDTDDNQTPDNNCTVIVTANGKRWKRKFDGNIQVKWAGIKYVDETDDAQDEAFSNLLKACAVDSPTGYPNKIIEDLSGRRIKLSKRYFIRGGVYNNNDTVGNTLHNRSARFGINASFVFDGSAGFVLLQMINPFIKLIIDNSDVTLTTAPTIDDYALRCECLVISPDIDIKVSQYTGTAYYQLGKYRTTDEFSSLWSDLTLSGTANYGGITNLNGGSINIASCGRGFYWKAGGAGLGHITSVWEQNCTNPSYFYDLQDFTFTSFETYVATVASDSITKAGDYFEQCGGHFGKLLAGQGGLPNIAFFGGSTVDIDHAFLVCGSAQGVFDNVSQTGMEVYDSVVMIGSAEVYHPNGRGFVVGGSSFVSIGSMLGKFPWQCVALGNDYITCVSGVTNNTSDARCIVNGFNIVRGNNSAYVTSSRPQFEISKNLIEFGGLSLSNGKFENVNNGFSDQSDQYVIKCNTDAAGALSIDNVKFSRINYPIYCNNPDNITKFIGNDFDNSKIYYQDGTSTNTGGRESPQGAFVTYFTGLKVGGSWQYWGKCPLRFSCRLTITSASATSILINGREVFYANETGHYSFTCALQYGDLISCTGTTANASVSGAMITFVRNVY